MDYNKFEFKQAVDDSQIAYIDCLKVGYDALYTGKKAKPDASLEEKESLMPTLEEVILAAMGPSDFEQAYKQAQRVAIKTGVPASEITIVDIAQFSKVLTEGDKRRFLELSPRCFDYRIKDIYDTNELNGFYSCCIYKGKGKISFAFRGSENSKIKSHFRHDWCNGDLALMQNEEIAQQREIESMLRYYRDIGTLDDCESITMSGHSLGGNLATHCGILLASDEFKKYLPKVKRVFNLDGPGFSKRYMMKHQREIRRIGFDRNDNESKIVQHPKWSLIGNLFNGLTYYSEDGEKVAERSSFLKIDEEKTLDFMNFRFNDRLNVVGVLDIMRKQFCRHTTESVTPRLDEYNRQKILSWEVEESRPDVLSRLFGPASRGIDGFVPRIITRGVGRVCTWMAENVFIRPKDVKPVEVLRGVDKSDTIPDDYGRYHPVPEGFYHTATIKNRYEDPNTKNRGDGHSR